MTISVKVTNTDSRECADIAVRSESLDGSNQYELGHLKGGESVNVYACHDMRLVVTEVSQ